MLDARPDEFDHRNLFLHALLGMLSACRRLDAAAQETSDPEEAPVPLDDPFLLGVLGMMSFRTRLGVALDAVPFRAPEEATKASDKGTIALRRMLR